MIFSFETPGSLLEWLEFSQNVYLIGPCEGGILVTPHCSRRGSPEIFSSPALPIPSES